MLKLDWGDAQVWMDTAVMLYARNATDPEKAQRRLPGYPWGNELNVAAVCAGYAFELIFKVLVKVRSGRPEPKHESSEAYRILRDIAPGDCDEIDRIVANHGWNNSSDLLKLLDEQFCDKDRKYWMRPPKGGRHEECSISVAGNAWIRSSVYTMTSLNLR